jgi:nucleolar protein 58
LPARPAQDTLAVCDAKLGSSIKEKLNIACVHDEGVLELMRVLRAQIEELVTAATPAEMRSMAIGLAHSLSRYKLKFSPDKVDTMIVQAIGLLDDLDKELNTYAMRLKEWYGWHFPEMAKVVPDNLMYAKAINKMGVRTQCKAVDFSDILPEEVETEMKEAAEISMGTEVSAEDTENILMLCDQVTPCTCPNAHLLCDQVPPARVRTPICAAPCHGGGFGVAGVGRRRMAELTSAGRRDRTAADSSPAARDC